MGVHMQVAKFAPEFERRGVKVIALSCDGLESHAAWIQDIQAHTGHTVSFPIIADEKRELATELAMLDPEVCRVHAPPHTRPAQPPHRRRRTRLACP